jgi:quercetin dioxygenase-like cupin family protein
MPIIINAEDTCIAHQGEGWTEFTLVDAKSISAPTMVARRWVLEPKAWGPELVQGDTDQLLYVIRGRGQAIVGGQEFSLGTESVLWLESGEQYRFIAAETGLEILQGYASGA